MSIEKISKRAMFEALIETMKTGECPYTAEQVIAFCEHEIELIDNKNAKAKERAATKAKEADALQNAVAEVLGEEFEPIADIAARIEGEDVTASKVSNRLNKLVAEGFAEKSQITIPASEGGKARRVVAFRKIG